MCNLIGNRILNSIANFQQLKMKYTTLTIIQLFVILFYTNAQNTSICAVKYKELKSNLGTYNHWFYKDKLISIKEPNQKAIYMRGFPVLINGVMTTQTDTLKYNKEFNDFVNERKDDLKKRQILVNEKYYNSNVLKTKYYDDQNKKDYIVLDTLAEMNNWEILDDTQTLLGYKCQKATINYNGSKYFAWFTTKLPYNAGPEGFRGLPGLILKVNNTEENIGYEAIEIEVPFKGNIPEFINKGTEISHSEWLVVMKERNKKAKESRENIINQLKKQAESKRQNQ